MFQYVNIQVVPGGELVVTCSRYEVVLLRHIRRQVGRPGGGQVQGEYIQVVERVPVEYQGVVTCVDSDGSTLIIGDSLQCSLPIILKIQYYILQEPVMHYLFGI